MERTAYPFALRQPVGPLPVPQPTVLIQVPLHHSVIKHLLEGLSHSGLVDLMAVAAVRTRKFGAHVESDCIEAVEGPEVALSPVLIH
jgi:hypothetical protein